MLLGVAEMPLWNCGSDAAAVGKESAEAVDGGFTRLTDNLHEVQTVTIATAVWKSGVTTFSGIGSGGIDIDHVGRECVDGFDAADGVFEVKNQ